MTSRTRLLVLAVSIPVIIFTLIGGYLGQALAKDDTYQHLRVFEDVISLVLNNYVEPVDVKQAMKGAMKGLAEGLDPESAFLTPDLVKAMESNTSAGPADVGIDLTRQYYLRVISARDGSPAAKAGIRSGDFIRAIDNRPTRDMSAFEGARLLHGAPGSKVSLLLIRGNAADPHMVDLVRALPAAAELTSRMADASTGYVRVVDFTKESPAKIKQAFDALAKTGAAKYIIDLRSTARGDLDDGLAASHLFVKNGILGVRLTKGDQKDVVTAQGADGAITAPRRAARRPGHGGSGRSLCLRTRRQQARGSGGRAHARARRAAEADQAARHERPLPHVPPLPHAVERSDPRKGSRARRRSRAARDRIRIRAARDGCHASEGARIPLHQESGIRVASLRCLFFLTA